ncbi:hypothetical protein E2C01_007352 [Portunus trituberculatus]|uniref:Uncharacterized protein n=1 Tax=Portunus trituberculatus TaxID=210409 RepID=A0A5B7D430_PORTR|nr:hypothetical protein [Portunus trituberculatus]
MSVDGLDAGQVRRLLHGAVGGATTHKGLRGLTDGHGQQGPATRGGRGGHEGRRTGRGRGSGGGRSGRPRRVGRGRLSLRGGV